MREDSPQRGLSRRAFWLALLVLLLPAGVPIYFAIVLEEGTALFIGGAVILIGVNMILLFAFNRWVRSLHE
jgi:hypothetical protein